MENTNTNTLANEIDKAVKEVVDEVKNLENLEVNIATNTLHFKGKTLEDSEEMELVVEDKTQNGIHISQNDNQLEFDDGILVVKQMLLEVLDKVAEKSTDCGKMEIPEEKDACEVESESQLLLKVSGSEKIDSSCEESVAQSSVEGHKQGLKRTHNDSELDSEVIDDTKDSSYIMSLVQDELSAVSKQLSTEEKTTCKLVDYESDCSEGDEECSDTSDSESSSTSSESTSSEESSVDERMIMDKIECEEDKVHVDPPKTKDELLLKDLPPEPLLDLELCDDVKLIHIGVITSIVESVVVIRSLPNTPALDADTLLFLENRKCLGKVFETFGPVQSPFYSVRFNNPDDITKAEIKPDSLVFFAPEELDYTKLIFTSQIEKLKGSDASWKHDQEPPVELVEYSDDEQETQAKSKMKQARKANRPSIQGPTDSTETASSLQPNQPKQPKEYQRTWQGRGRGRNMQGNHPRQPFPEFPPCPRPVGPPLGHLPPPPFQHPQGGHFNPHIPPPEPGQYFPPPLPHCPPALPHLGQHCPPALPHPGQYCPPPLPYAGQPCLPPPALPPVGYPPRPPTPYPDMTYQHPPPPGSSPWPSFNYRPPQQ